MAVYCAVSIFASFMILRALGSRDVSNVRSSTGAAGKGY